MKLTLAGQEFSTIGEVKTDELSEDFVNKKNFQ